MTASAVRTPARKAPDPRRAVTIRELLGYLTHQAANGATVLTAQEIFSQFDGRQTRPTIRELRTMGHVVTERIAVPNGRRTVVALATNKPALDATIAAWNAINGDDT